MITNVGCVNLAYWGILPMGITNYGGDIQVFDIPEYAGQPIQMTINPMAQMQLAAAGAAGGGLNIPPIGFGDVNSLSEMFLASAMTPLAETNVNANNSNISGLKTRLNSLLNKEGISDEDKQEVERLLAELDTQEEAMKALKDEEGLSNSEIYEKSKEINKNINKIARDVKNISQKINATETCENDNTDEPEGVSSQNFNPQTASSIKPGLLKGNLVGKEKVIEELCNKYNVDIALVLTIIGQESGFGTSNLASHNNFMGYRAAGDCGKSSKGFGYFSTPEKGLEAAIENLSQYPQRYPEVQKADLSNIDAIAQHYCEGNEYPSAIKNLYNTTVKEYLA